jgi:hypothetical protein
MDRVRVWRESEIPNRVVDSQEGKGEPNYKELQNLVDTVKVEARAGRLQGCKFFLFTDNSTAKSCYYHGSSKSKQLYLLVLEPQMLEMKFGLTIHIVHISGKRMIAQGTDGCSRGSLMEDVMAGEDMLTFVDLALPATERYPPLIE